MVQMDTMLKNIEVNITPSTSFYLSSANSKINQPMISKKNDRNI
jgi:hypothetical protein